MISNQTILKDIDGDLAEAVRALRDATERIETFRKSLASVVGPVTEAEAHTLPYNIADTMERAARTAQKVTDHGLAAVVKAAELRADI